MFLNSVNVFLQVLHPKGFSPVRISSWFLRFPDCEKDFLQNLHSNGENQLEFLFTNVRFIAFLLKVTRKFVR